MRELGRASLSPVTLLPSTDEVRAPRIRADREGLRANGRSYSVEHPHKSSNAFLRTLAPRTPLVRAKNAIGSSGERAIFAQPRLCILCTNRMLTGAAESVWRSKLCKR